MSDKLTQTLKDKTNLQKKTSRLSIKVRNTETVNEKIESNEVEI